MRRNGGRVVGTHPCGADHAVLSVVVTDGGASARSQVCAECPWRTDRPTGVFPVEAFRHSANTAYDGATTMFACHMAGKEAPATCAGFLLRNSRHNIGARLAAIKGRIVYDSLRETAPLYESYREMAVANGVDPDDSALARCRADDE